jgi:SSS family solute:Na+ symporter
MDGMRAALPETAFSITHIGGQTIITYFVVYFLGLVIGQDIWQRVFTARSEGVAKWAGVTSGVYCILYAFAGVLIGMCAKVLLPDIEVRDKVYPTIVEYALPVGISGLVMAAALSAIMSTSSGALIATATVVKEDILEKLTGRTAPPETSHEQRDEVRHSRIYILLFGVLMIAAACVVRGVVEALTIAYDILVGGLMVAIIGGFLWPRGTLKGALASIIVGTALTLGTMWAVGDVYANEPIFAGIGGSLLVYVVVSLMTPATPAAIRDEWNRRIKSRRADQASAT